ncbi:probable ubiquitin carboxyl-terminal hydrolase 17 at C-terminar half [Coccomyxa sp. Obi]|nr:probable ubiquitin carboxyl-terminal hydrolase 17 at C-terminar half [Coccomyxa sp. Obi]
MKVPEGKRTVGMLAIIEQEKLQKEVDTLLLHLSRLTMLESRVGSIIGNFIGMQENFLMEIISKTIKALLVLDGNSAELRLSRMKSLVRMLPAHLKVVYSTEMAHKSVLQRAKHVKTPLHMLAAVPLFMAANGVGDCAAMKRTSDVALRAIELNCADWHDSLRLWGVSTRDVELVMHVALPHMYINDTYDKPPDMDGAACDKATTVSINALWKLDPGNPWGAVYTTMLPPDMDHKSKVLSRALGQAEERNDEGPLALVLWLTAYCMLVGYEGPTFKIPRFLDITARAQKAHELAQSWGYDQIYRDPRPFIVWRCRGVAAHLKADIRRNPAVAEGLRLQFYSDPELDAEMEYTRCDGCRELTSKLLCCSQCQRAKYCSSQCQKLHWRKGHKRACKPP